MPRLEVDWKSSDCESRGFYDPDEDRLVVCIDRPGKFATFVDGEDVSYDLDTDGYLLGITVDAARESWQVTPDLIAPRIGIPATIKFLDTPAQVEHVRFLTEPDLTMLRIEFSDKKPVHIVQPCEGILLDIGDDGELLATWVLNIQEDLGSRRQRDWRKSHLR